MVVFGLIVLSGAFLVFDAFNVYSVGFIMLFVYQVFVYGFLFPEK